jgi:hypothetical protein
MTVDRGDESQPGFEAAATLPEQPTDPGGNDHWTGLPSYTFGYDHGFEISSTDLTEAPFSLKFNFENQFRYVGFARGVESWTDSAGNVMSVTNRNNLEIPRGRVIFSGMALLPEVRYQLDFDYNTVSDRQVNLRGYWLSYQFSRAVSLYVGQDMVPGSREWLTSSRNTLGPDRSLATTFFRPSLSQGVWVIGEPIDGFHYRAMVANGFNTGSVTAQKLDNLFAYAASAWWEPMGEFGPALSDLEWHDDPAIRVGASGTVAPVEGLQDTPNFPENNEIRLSDGTLITATGALAPGVTVTAFGIALGAIDFGFKHRGFSFTSELYLRDIFNLKADGPLPRSSMFDIGGYGQIGFFLVPRKFEVYTRTSHVTGPFGTGGEYAGGWNWYILPGSQNLRLTIDVAWINHSPADQNRTDYRAGDTGWLIRTQFQTYF